MKVIRLIIFDFDGTLADTGSAIKQAFWKTLSELKVSLSNAVPFDELASFTLVDMFRAVGVCNGRLFEAEHIYQIHYKTISSQKVKLYPGVPETLDLLRTWGYDLAIATNEHRRNLDRLLSSTGISSFFCSTVCENEVAHTKPDPQMAKSIMTELNRSPHQTLIVGDSILDVQMGQAVGGFTCGAAYGAYSEKKLAASGPHWMIGTFGELPSLLQIPHCNRKEL